MPTTAGFGNGAVGNRRSNLRTVLPELLRSTATTPRSASPALIPLTDLRASHEACRGEWERRLDTVFSRSQWILGPEVAAFEQEFAAFCGAPACIGVGTGTDALNLALRLSGITSSGQHVITTPLTAPFTALAILAAGARPVFADIEEETLLLDPAKAAAQMTPRTAALLPVHLYGLTCDLLHWAELAASSGCVLIQDACQAHGARHAGRPLTYYSPLVAYSFYPTKNLGALGDGGALCAVNKETAERARLLRDGGRDHEHISTVPGINSRLDEIQASYLRVALEHLEQWNDTRRKLAALYGEELAGLPPEVFRPAGRGPESDHVYHLYVARASRRNELQEYLAANQVMSGVHYRTPLHLQPAFAEFGAGAGSLPVAEKAAREVISLPMGPYLKEDEVRRIADLIRRFYRSC
jgi:dTDP-3-amino-3,4,6-trideoxy-alpha-D-glucose transaminase